MTERHTTCSQFTSVRFRKELTRIMPGYNWTVHKTSNEHRLEATGVQSSGFNRLSTLSVIRLEQNGVAVYEAKSAGFGRRARWMHSHTDATLSRALRGLQDYYQEKATIYRSHCASLQRGRMAEGGAE